MPGRRDVRPVPSELRESDDRLYRHLKDRREESEDGIPSGHGGSTGALPETVSGDSPNSAGDEDSGWAAADHSHALETSGAPGNVTLAASAQGAGPGASLSGHTHGLDDEAVTLAKLQHVTAPTLLGRDTGGAGDVKALTPTEATTIPEVFTAALKGLAPASGGGTANFLRADGTWAAPSGTADDDARILAYCALVMRR